MRFICLIHFRSSRSSHPEHFFIVQLHLYIPTIKFVEIRTYYQYYPNT